MHFHCTFKIIGLEIWYSQWITYFMLQVFKCIQKLFIDLKHCFVFFSTFIFVIAGSSKKLTHHVNWTFVAFLIVVYNMPKKCTKKLNFWTCCVKIKATLFLWFFRWDDLYCFCFYFLFRLYLIFEFLEMDLRKFLDKMPQGRYMDKELVKSYMHQVNQAILFCHTRRILHRDLKPQNLLITRDGTIKVSDNTFHSHFLLIYYITFSGL